MQTLALCLPITRWHSSLMTEENPTICVTVSYCAHRSRLTMLMTTLLVWSNFEIGDLDHWRGEAYSKFFDYLDEQGGFYYEVSLVFVHSGPYFTRNSVGEMHQFIASEPHCLRRRIRFTSSMTSDIDMSPSSTVRREM